MNFRIFLTPQRGSDLLYLEKAGDLLTINGQRLDFSALSQDRDKVDSVNCLAVVGPVVRVGQELQLTVLWPYGTTYYVAATETEPEQIISIPMPEFILLAQDGPAVFEGAGEPAEVVTDVVIEAQSVKSAAVRLQSRRDAVWERVKQERQRRRQSGVTAAGHWFHSDDTSRIQQLGLVMMGANIPAGLMWRTMDNGEVEMTQTLAMQIFQATAASDAAHFQVAKDIRAVIDASDNPESVDITAGWPASYGT